MNKILLLMAVWLVGVTAAYPQSGLPVIHASSATVSVRDGGILKRDFWHLSPELRPDTYFVDVPRGRDTVTFITDLDSISIPTRYGQHVDFVIVLNGKDSCFTRVSAVYSGVFSPVRTR